MDDFDIPSLSFSNNEYVCFLTNSVTPLIIEGFYSIFEESTNLCKSNNEDEKYLMTFQNFITRIPKWSNAVVEEEKKRIVEKSKITYIEDLLSCVHIVQLKAMTNIRVGSKQKKIQIKIPKFSTFIHKCYIQCARKIYKNVYLFEKEIPALQIQKNMRDLEVIVQECILQTIREGIPIEDILKSYLDDTLEEYVEEEVKEEVVKPEPEAETSNVEVEEQKVEEVEEQLKTEDESKNQMIKFNDVDNVKYSNDKIHDEIVPKSIENLEIISKERNEQRKLEEEQEEDEDLKPLNIGNDNISLDFEFENLSDPPQEQPPLISLENDFLLNDIEVLG